jgi:hypothetical protein
MSNFHPRLPAKSAHQPSESLLSQQLGKSMPTQSSSTQSFCGSTKSRSIKEIKTVRPGTNTPFLPESREEFLQDKFEGSKKKFMNHFRLQRGISELSLSLSRTTLIFLIGDETAEKEADVMIERMRGHPDGHSEIIIQRANASRTRSKSEVSKYEGRSEEQSYGWRESQPYCQMGSSYQDDLLFPMEEDTQYIETPAQRRAIQEDMSPVYSRIPPSIQQNQSYCTPDQQKATRPSIQQGSSFIAPAQAQQQVQRDLISRAQLVHMDYGATHVPFRYLKEDNERGEYDDDDDDSDGFKDMSGFEDGTQHYNDFRGEYDGGYGEY